MLKHSAANRKRRLSALPNVGPHIYTTLKFLALQGAIYIYTYTGCLQKNGAVLKINKKFISHLTRAKLTPSAAATVQVFYALIIILHCVHAGSHDTHPHDNRIRPI
jgi:hypothetical protein